LVASIKSDFGRFGPKLKEVRKNLENWRLFYNPYHRLEGIAKRYSEELTEIIKEPFELPPDPPAFPTVFKSTDDSINKDIDEFVAEMKSLSEKYIRAQELSTSLRLICPVWAEAFINFLIFILAREEIKNDHRLYQDFIRKEIDVRVKLLHINCVGFEKPIDSKHKTYKEFHTLMNERNDLLHGNIDPNKLGYETVFFDETIPLFTEPQGLARNSLGISLKGIEPEETIEKVKLVQTFIDFILTHLGKSYKEQISSIIQKRELGWRSETSRVGVLFADFIAEGFAF